MSDQDSSSSSSPSTTNPEADPSEPLNSSNYPETPLNDHLNASAPGELSPPRSQEAQSIRQHIQSPLDDRSEDMIDEELADADPEFYQSDGGPTSTAAETKGTYIPGSGWNNKKAQDEFHRAMETVVDQDFSLREFGDPLLDAVAGNGSTTQGSTA